MGWGDKVGREVGGGEGASGHSLVVADSLRAGFAEGGDGSRAREDLELWGLETSGVEDGEGK